MDKSFSFVQTLHLQMVEYIKQNHKNCRFFYKEMFAFLAGDGIKKEQSN